MRRFYLMLAAVCLTAPIAGAQPTRDSLAIRTFVLQRLSSTQAANLIGPYVGESGAVYEAGQGGSGITVRAWPRALASIDSLLREVDRPWATTMVRIQLVEAAEDGSMDPALREIEAGLRELMPRGRFRVLAEGVTMVGETRPFQLTVSSGQERFFLSGGVDRVTFVPGAAPAVDLAVSLKPETSEPIFQTGLRVPSGKTVILGSAAEPRGSRRLILVVRAEIQRP